MHRAGCRSVQVDVPIDEMHEVKFILHDGSGDHWFALEGFKTVGSSGNNTMIGKPKQKRSSGGGDGASVGSNESAI